MSVWGHTGLGSWPQVGVADRTLHILSVDAHIMDETRIGSFVGDYDSSWGEELY